MTDYDIVCTNIVRTHWDRPDGEAASASLNLSASQYATRRLLRTDASELRTGVETCVRLLTQPPLGQSYDTTLSSWQTEYHVVRWGEASNSQIVRLGEVFLDYAIKALSGRLRGSVHEGEFLCRGTVEYRCAQRERVGAGERLLLALYVPRVSGVLHVWDEFARHAVASLTESVAATNGPLLHVRATRRLAGHFAERLHLSGEVCGVQLKTAARQLNILLERAREDVKLFESL